ncbi:TRAP transporter substrate-binding protein DctP [Neobacillus sp. 114]|uniref:TRAP transporter substrate-binding protein n=1 Tax=Neobacillus sp. 114 TaxID=3048535 RepID=UPI0024C3C903|nr:TRAP transporter substrate-binding protein DctP [Neobacillus sp. 114]
MSAIKKSYLLFIILLLIGLIVGCGKEEASNSKNVSSKKGSSDKVYELNVNNWAPSTHHYAYNVYEPWKKLVEEKTNGRVKVNIYHGSALGKSTSVYQDVKGGLYEVGVAVTSYFPDTDLFPYTIGNLPFAFNDAEEASKVLKKFGEKYANESLSKEFIVMNPLTTDPYDLFSSKPIKSIDDLKKTKMRSSSNSETTLEKAIGAVPVTISTDGAYEGLQKKQIDSTFYTPIGSVGLKFYEPAPYITKVHSSVMPVIPIMNKSFYESLPDDLQKIFDKELNPKLSELLIKSYETEVENAYKTLEEKLKDRGKIITLSDKEVQRFKEAGKVSWDEWIEEANKKGYPGQEMVDELIKIMAAEGLPKPF